MKTTANLAVKLAVAIGVIACLPVAQAALTQVGYNIPSSSIDSTTHQETRQSSTESVSLSYDGTAQHASAVASGGTQPYLNLSASARNVNSWFNGNTTASANGMVQWRYRIHRGDTPGTQATISVGYESAFSMFDRPGEFTSYINASIGMWGLETSTPGFPGDYWFYNFGGHGFQHNWQIRANGTYTDGGNQTFAVNYDQWYGLSIGADIMARSYDGSQFASVTASIDSTVAFAQGWLTAHPGDWIEFDTTAPMAVPEPSTCIAGALLLLPFGASALRMLRKSRTA